MKKLALAMVLVMLIGSVAQAGELVLNEPVTTCTQSGLTLEECKKTIERYRKEGDDLALGMFIAIIIGSLTLLYISEQ